MLAGAISIAELVEQMRPHRIDPVMSAQRRVGRSSYGTVTGIRAWFAGFDGPVQITFRDPVVTQDGDLAFAYTLTNMTVTRVGQQDSISVWYRSTFGLRHVDGSWRIAHRHDSTPFYMDGSNRAATDLEP